MKVPVLISIICGVLWLGITRATKSNADSITEEITLNALDSVRLEEFERFFHKSTAGGGKIEITTHIHIAGSEGTSSSCQATATSKPSVVTGPSNPGERCKSNMPSGSYWLSLQNKQSINYTQAKRLCEANGSYVAHIPNEKLYDEIVALLRSNANDSANMWINTLWILKVNPKDSFHNFDLTEATVKHTRAYVIIPRSNRLHGMKDAVPSKILDGAVCWKVNECGSEPCTEWLPQNGGGCFCIQKSSGGTDFENAGRSYCNLIAGGQMAEIRDEESYIAIVKMVQSMIPSNGRMTLWFQKDSEWRPSWKFNDWDEGFPVKISGNSVVSVAMKITTSRILMKLQNHYHSVQLDGVICQREGTSSEPNRSEGTCYISHIKGDYILSLETTGSKITYSEAENLCDGGREIADIVVGGSLDDAIVKCLQELYQSNDNIPSTGINVWTGLNLTWRNTSLPGNELFRRWYKNHPKENGTHVYLEVEGIKNRKIKTLLSAPTTKRLGVVCWNNFSSTCPNHGVNSASRGCFWIETPTGLIDYNEANATCYNRSGQIASITDNTILHGLIEKLQFIGHRSISRRIWIDMNVTWVPQRQPSYVGNTPKISEGPISISVSGTDDGMRIRNVNESLDGVLCWKPPNTTLPLTKELAKNLTLCEKTENEGQCQHGMLGCFWLHLREKDELIDYDEATKICRDNKSAVFAFNDHATMNAVKNYAIEDLTIANGTIWLGTAYYLSVLEVGPHFNSSNYRAMAPINIYLDIVDSSIKRASPCTKTNGVICWKYCPNHGMIIDKLYG